MFSESSPCLLGQHGSCSTANSLGTLKKHFTKPSEQVAAPPGTYLCLRAKEVRLGVRPARGDEVKVLAGGVLEQLCAVDDEIVVDFDDALGGKSIETFWLEFRLEKPLEFWLEIPPTKKTVKNG